MTKPKKPVAGAYGIFLAECRAGGMEAPGGKQNSREIVREAARRWKECTPEEKAVYQAGCFVREYNPYRIVSLKVHVIWPLSKEKFQRKQELYCEELLAWKQKHPEA